MAESQAGDRSQVVAPATPGAAEPGSDLASRRCVACEGGAQPLLREEAQRLLAQVSSRWKLSEDGRALEREIAFRDFRRAMDFLNALADVAEQEGHHPDFTCSYNRVTLRLCTHSIGGLSENDFILAAKIEELLRARREQAAA